MKKKLFSALTLMSLALGLCLVTASCEKADEPVTPSKPDTPSDPDNGGSPSTVKPQYVDLGLPSGTKWATFNVGAASPEEPGGYYAWGETFQKNDYSKETYTVAGITEDFSGDSRYDVATAKWGDNWRTPKIEEITELIEECEWERGSLAGVNGWWVTGPNGNHIFLPQGGYYSDNYLAGVGSWGKYWSSTPSSGSYSALMDMLGSSSPSKGYTARYSGYSVRPVYYEKAPAQPRESVDLGLSVEWATYNVGSEAPEDYGDFYAWGEIKTKTTYTEENCQTLDMEIADFAGNPLYDAAAYEWGGAWRMPTKEEVEELIYECEWRKVKRNSIPGYQVTGTNGNSIFLPLSGYMSDSYNGGRREQCNFWTSTPQYNDRAWNMNAYGLGGSRGYISRHYGYSIRPVRPSSASQGKPILYATPNEASLKANVGKTATTIISVSGENLQGDITLSLWGTNASMFSISSRVISQSVGKKDIVVTYSPTRTGSHSVEMEIRSTGAETVTVPLTGTAEESVISINGHDAVDLGLSVRWATCNVGATKPEEYGDYFAWGETSPKSSYTKENSLTYGKGFAYIGGGRYDAASVNWGGSWRLPTKDEIDELTSNCSFTWTTSNGVNGYEVKSKINGNSIFLPAAGYRYGTSLYYAGGGGLYWSSTPSESTTQYAYYLYFDSSEFGRHWYNRYYGQSVRPVTE